MMINEYKSPGQLLTALLAQRGWSKRVLASILEIDETALNRLCSDQRPLTTDLALMLEEVFEIEAVQLLRLQTDYDLAKARITWMPDASRKRRVAIYSELPISDMIKRGWLDAANIKDFSAVEKSLLKFFDTDSIQNIESLPHSAKKTNSTTATSPIQMAWVYRVRQIASEMLVPRFSIEQGIRLVEKLRPLMSSVNEVRKAPRLLAEAGIRFVIVESLPSAKIDGVCFWLDEFSPVIALSTRFDRIDNFWFVLRHELEHVLLGHGKQTPMIDTELEGGRAGTGEEVAEEERLANAAASEFCVPSKKLAAFISRKAPFFKEHDLLGFAATLGVHPGIVAGQVRNKTQKYNLFSKHLVNVRSIVGPSAIVDGWGNIAPVHSSE